MDYCKDVGRDPVLGYEPRETERFPVGHQDITAISLPRNISAALVKAQKNFSPALKGSTNPHFKSKYADLSACVEAVVDALNDAGIMLTQACHVCEGNAVVVETIFIHESGERFSAGLLRVPASKADAQGIGSAMTYARRYSLMAACGIAPEDDDGNAACNGKNAPPMASPAPNTDPAIVATLSKATTMEELQDAWKRIPVNTRRAYETAKDEAKRRISLIGEAA